MQEKPIKIDHDQTIGNMDSSSINESFNSPTNDSFNDNSHHNNNKSITIYNEYEYKELSKKELKELRKKEKSARFGLAPLCQKPVRCIGLLIDNILGCKDGIERSTVINLVDLNTGKYLSDHINIERNLVTDIIESSDKRIIFVEIYGRVYKYDDGNDRYSVNPLELKQGYIKQISEVIINPYEVIDYTKVNKLEKGEIEDIEDWLKYELNTTELKLLLEYLRDYINKLTKIDLHENFIYNYIINNYMLNSSQFELFYKELPTDKLNKNHYVELVYLLSNLIIKLSRNEQFNVVDVFEENVKILLPFMGIMNVADYKNRPSYTKFRNLLGIEEKNMDFVIRNLFSNFKLHPFDIYNKNTIIIESSHFLKAQKDNLKRKIDGLKGDKI